MMLPYSTNVIVIWLICLSLLMVLTILDIWCGWLFSLATFMRPPRCKKVAPDRWNISSTFSTSRCSQSVDKTMEQTFMKFAKSVGGFSSTFCMFGAYERWCRATSTRAQYHKKLLEMCGLINDPDYPKKGKD